MYKIFLEGILIFMKVYMLQHSYEYEIYEGIKETNAKFIGIYSSLQNAEEAKERFKNKKGFNRFPEACFLISEHILDENHWFDGFISLKKEKGRKKYDIPKKIGKEKKLNEKYNKVAVKGVLKDKVVYYLEHSYEYEISELDIKIDSIKFIGIYSSKVKAEEIRDQIKIKFGFNKFSEDCFCIDRYYLDKDYKGWTEGFITWDGETDSWIE